MEIMETSWTLTNSFKYDSEHISDKKLQSVIYNFI